MADDFGEALELYKRLRLELGLSPTQPVLPVPDTTGAIAPLYHNTDVLELACRQTGSFDEQRPVLLAAVRSHLADHAVLGGPALDRALAAMAKVPRERFLPEPFAALAYLPISCAIGHEQMISNPHIVAAMTSAADVGPDTRVLDVGTGCGYQAAVLAQCARNVISIEIIPELAQTARIRLAELGYDGIHVLTGDGAVALSAEPPFDAIVVAAGAPEVPAPLLNLLDMGGRLVMPIGPVQNEEQLVLVTRSPDGFRHQTLGPVRFVPLTGTFGRSPDQLSDPVAPQRLEE